MSGEQVNLEELGLTKEQYDGLTEEERQQLLAAHKPEEEKEIPESEKQIRGILADLKKERERRSMSEGKTVELEERIQELETALAEKKETSITTEDNEDVATVGRIKEILADVLTKKEAEYNQRVNALEARILSSNLKTSEDGAKEIYSVEKVGEKLSYDNVIDNGFALLVKENPSYKAVVINSQDPAKEAYKIGLTHPDFQALLKKKAAGEIVEKLTTTKVKTGVGSGQGSTGFDASKATIQDLLKLTDKELEDLRRQT